MFQFPAKAAVANRLKDHAVKLFQAGKPPNEIMVEVHEEAINENLDVIFPDSSKQVEMNGCNYCENSV